MIWKKCSLKSSMGLILYDLFGGRYFMWVVLCGLVFVVERVAPVDREWDGVAVYGHVVCARGRV